MNDFDSRLLELPTTWLWTTIGEIAETTSGGTPSRKKSEYYGGTVPWIKSGELNDGLIQSAEECITEDALENSNAKIFPKGTVLVALYGATIGRTAILNIDASTNQAICAIFPRKDTFLPKFMVYWLKFNHDRLINLGIGGAQPNINQGIVRSFPFPLSSLPEQHRIVARIEELFSHLDAGVLALQRAKAQLQRYRQAVLKAAVEGRLTEGWRKAHPEVEPAEELLEQISNAHQRPPERIESTQLPNLPRSWIWASTDQLASCEKYSMAIGPFGSNLKVVDYRSEGVPLIFVRNIRLRLFNGQGTWFVSNEKAEELRAHFVESGDILITKMGDPPGDACIYPEGMPPAIITADCIKWRLSSLLKEKAYFSNAINSIVVKKQIIQITKGVAQQKISLIRFKKVGIPLPPLQEQNEIAKCIESRFSFFDQTEIEFDRAIQLSASLRQSILKRAFVGKLVPQDPSDEPASMLLERIRAERTEETPRRGRKSNNSTRQMRLAQ
jgi:type I restriction enzyme S subunit